MTYPNPTTAFSPSTELGAVNFMLATIGAQPVASLPSTILDASIANTTLYQVLSECLAEGWYFNSYWNYVVTADGSGFINLPTNVISAMLDPSKAPSSAYDPVQKGTKMWDRKNQTYVFPAGTQITLGITEMMDFVDIPPPAQWYVTARAAHLFADRTLGAANVHQYIIEQEVHALATLKQINSDHARDSMFDNQSVGRIVDRIGPVTSGSAASILSYD